MSVFYFTELVNDPIADVVSATLGVDANNKFSDADVGKGVKLGPSNNYIPLADGDEIEGIVISMEPATYNDGFSFGSVQKDRRMKAQVGAGQTGALAVGALVVADVPIALGTDGIVQVKAGAPSVHMWRVLRHVTGTGVSGDTVLIERI